MKGRVDQANGGQVEEPVVFDAVTSVPVPANEPIKTYAPGSAERAALETKIKDLAREPMDLTMTVGGVQRMGGGDWIDVVQPHNHAHKLGRLGEATDEDVSAAIEAAALAAPGWRELSFDDRAAIFLRAAELLAGPWRSTINASTMLGQSKSVYQAEIDAACELIDFWRYNVHFGRRLLAEQPESTSSAWNRLEDRPLEGFVLAITPFNFTSIAGNLPTAPALLGNVVLWKPSPTQQFSAHYTMRLLEAARRPPRRGDSGTRAGRAWCPATAGRCPGSRWPTRTWPAFTSPARPGPSRPCGAPSGRTFPVTAATRGWSARPAVRDSAQSSPPPNPNHL